MKKHKKLIAFLMAGFVLIMAIIPHIVFGGINDDDNQTTWTKEFEDWAFATYDMNPTGLRIRQESYGPQNGEFAFGVKTFFDDGKNKVKDEFKNFVGNYFFCIGMHANAQPMLSWSQMFNDKVWSVDALPDAGVMSMDKAATEEERKFNFLMVVFSSAMLGDHTVAECEDMVKSTAQFAVAAEINWAACDSGLFNGNSLEEDWAVFESTYYQSILDEFKTNKPSQVPYNEIVSFGKIWFTEIWNTAKSAMSMEIEEGSDNTILKGKQIEKDGTYYVVVPYPGYVVDDTTGTITATSGANETICANWSTVKANNLKGDWEFEGAHDNAIWFKSPSGEITEDEFASIYWDNEGSQMTMTGKDFTTWMNVGAAELYSFQCARAKNPENKGTTDFNNTWEFGSTQTFFAADFSTKKDIIVKIGTNEIKPKGDYNVEVDRYKHNEMFLSHYNVNLRKFDSETGKPLEGAQFDILEAFDSEQEGMDSIHITYKLFDASQLKEYNIPIEIYYTLKERGRV